MFTLLRAEVTCAMAGLWVLSVLWEEEAIPEVRVLRKQSIVLAEMRVPGFIYVLLECM